MSKLISRPACRILICFLALVLGYRRAAAQNAVAGAPIVAFAQARVGLVSGIARDAVSGKPMSDAQVTAHSLDQGADQATRTGVDGFFTFTNLEPGQYEVTASKNGFQKSSARVHVTANRIAQVDLPLEIAAGSTAATGPSANQPLTERERQLLERIDRLEGRLAAIEAAVTTTSSGSRTTARSGPLVASLTPVAGLPPVAASPDTQPVLGPTAQQSPQQSGGKAGPVATPPTQVAPAEHRMPDALQTPEPGPTVDDQTPFAYGDFSWLNGSARTKDTVLDTKFFTPEIRFDTNYMEDFNQPVDHTIVGSTESFRSGEVQIEQASVGGDFHWENVRGRILFMDGLFATTTPRNDASSATGSGNGNTGGVGQWDLQNAYKYVSEAYGGYHFNVQHGLNVDAGIFVSYIGLFSYYNFDNWTYQPSYVSSNTPWFFNGVRVQWFPTNKLKIEPWFINGWQSYAKYNGHPGLGGQLLWMPKEWFKLVANQYGYGEDNIGLPKTQRIHTDDSIEVRYYSNPESFGLSKMAFSLTGDAGCQYGGGITCHSGPNKSSFLGWMLYDRMWFHKDLFALTLGGGEMNRPCCRRLMGPGLHPARHTSRKIPARRPRCGIAPLTSSTCPGSTSRGGSRLDIATPMSRTSQGAAASLPRAEITVSLNTTRVRRARRREPRTWREQKPPAEADSAASGSRIFAAAKQRSRLV